MNETQLKPQVASNVVTVRIPASVAYNFDQITKVTQNILGKLGCGGCHSGRDIRLVIEDYYRVDEKLNVYPVIANVEDHAAGL